MGKYRTSMSGGALEKYHLVEFSLRKFTSINELNHILSKIIIYVVKYFLRTDLYNITYLLFILF